MSNLYKLSPTERGYQFQTNSGLTYHLYFTEYYLKDSQGDDVKVQSFGFFPEPGIPRKEIKKNRYDGKVKATIISFITEYFEKNPDIGLLYLCDPNDGYARHRSITFSQWYKEFDFPIEKFDCLERHRKAGYYTSILIRSDNPLKDYYVEAFYRSLEEFFPEEI